MTLNLLFLFFLFLDNLFVLVHFFLCVCGGWATRSQSLTLVLRLIIGLGADPCIYKVCTIILCLSKIIKWINTCNNLNSLLCSIINRDCKHLFDTPTPYTKWILNKHASVLHSNYQTHIIKSSCLLIPHQYKFYKKFTHWIIKICPASF